MPKAFPEGIRKPNSRHS